jgi:hypothetical protein
MAGNKRIFGRRLSKLSKLNPDEQQEEGRYGGMDLSTTFII